MIDQLFGLLLIGLGLKTPHILPPGAVKGDSTEAIVEETPKTEEPTSSEKPKRADFKNEQKPPRDFSGVQAGEKQVKGVLRPDGKPSMGDMKRDEMARTGSAPGMAKFREEIKAKREEAKEAFAQKREEFKQRLSNIKDERKKTIVANLDTKISDMNTKRTNIMLEQLAKMEEILTKAQTSMEEFSAQGKDTSKLSQAITSAQGVVAEAKTAVSTQASKEYIPQVLSEDRLKSDVQTTISQIQQDLKAVEDVMMKARQSIRVVIEEIALIQGEK